MAEAGVDHGAPRPRSPQLQRGPVEKMEKMMCVLCPKSHHECCVLYLARAESIAAHENCLKCKVCGEKGVTVGCDFKACRKTYHFFCAKKDNAFLEVDGAQGTYKLLCQKHAPKPPGATAPHDDNLRMDGEGGRNQSDNPQPAAESRSKQQKRSMREDPIYHTAKTMKVSFLKKCKKAGLLNDLFEGMLSKLHLIHGRLMEETASESDYEEIESSLFDCRLFEDTLIEFQAAIMGRILESEERHWALREELRTLEELRQRLCSFQETRDLDQSSSSSVSSNSF